MAYTDASTGWGLTPGAASANLSRMAGGGYGSMYGDNNNSPIYEQRMAQIRGNFAARQAQLAEERRRTEMDQSNDLAKQKFQSQNDQFEKEYLMRQNQYNQSQENWQKKWDFDQQKYEDDRKEAERQRILSMYGSRTPPTDPNMRSKWYEAIGIPEPVKERPPWDPEPWLKTPTPPPVFNPGPPKVKLNR